MDKAHNTHSLNYLSPHFSVSEMTFSQWAVRNGVANEPNHEQAENLKRVAALLEGVRRALLDMPITISSGFRNVQVNWAIGGVETSAHVDGLAADFVCPDYGTPADIMQRLLGTPAGRLALYAPVYGNVAGKTPLFDQLILEERWVHLGLALEGKRPRGQVLQATFKPLSKPVYTLWKPL